MKDYGIFNEIVDTTEDTPVAKTKSYGIFDEVVTATPADYYTKPVDTPALTQVEPVKPTFKTFSDLTLGQKFDLGFNRLGLKVGSGIGSITASTIKSLSYGKDLIKGILSDTSVSEELANDTTFDKKIKGFANEYQKLTSESMSSQLAKRKEELGLDPNDQFVDKVFEGVGSLIGFVGTGSATKVASVALGFGKYASKVASGVNVVGESLAEAQDVYETVKAEGGDDRKAFEAFRSTLAGNALLIGLTNKLGGMFDDTMYRGIKRAVKIGVSGTMEGAQEGYQTLLSNANTGKPLFEGVKESFLIGTILGAPASASLDFGNREKAKEQISAMDIPVEQKEVATAILDNTATEEQVSKAFTQAVTNPESGIELTEDISKTIEEDTAELLDQGQNVGEVVIALQEEGLKQSDAENVVAKVIAEKDISEMVKEQERLAIEEDVKDVIVKPVETVEVTLPEDTVTVNGKVFQLKGESLKRWKEEKERSDRYIKNLPNTERGNATRKGEGMKMSALKRELTGEYTPTELANKIAQEQSNYRYKKVLVDVNGNKVKGVIISPPSFGNFKVELENGKIISTVARNISDPRSRKEIIDKITKREESSVYEAENKEEKREIKPLKDTGVAMKDKEVTVGNKFSDEITKNEDVYIKNANKVKNGEVNDEIKDGKIIGKTPKKVAKIKTVENKEVKLNYKNAKNIIEKHGKLDTIDLVATINIPDIVVVIKTEGGKEIINFIKFFDGGMQVAGTVSIKDGFASITHYEKIASTKQKDRRIQNHLNQLLKRGEIAYVSEKTADLPLIVGLTTSAKRAVIELSGIGTETSIPKPKEQVKDSTYKVSDEKRKGIRSVAKNLEDKAKELGISIDDSYEMKRFVEEVAISEQYLENNKDKIEDILNGAFPFPTDVSRTAFLHTIIENAKAQNDTKTLTKAYNMLAEEGTKAGQDIAFINSIYKTYDETSPETYLNKIKAERESMAFRKDWKLKNPFALKEKKEEFIKNRTQRQKAIKTGVKDRTTIKIKELENILDSFMC